MHRKTGLIVCFMAALSPLYGQSRLAITPPWHDTSNAVAAALSQTVYDTLAFEFGGLSGFTLVQTKNNPTSEQDLYRFARDEKLDFIVFGRLDRVGGQYRLNVSLYDHENRAITANKSVAVARMNDIFQVTDRMFALLLADIDKTGSDERVPEAIDPALLFGGGKGTTSDPFVISTASHLINLDMYPLATCRVTADIDLTGIDWVPVAVFYGKLSGEGHLVSGLTIPGDRYKNSGLFGMLAPGSEVAGLRLTGVSVRSKGMGGSVCAVNLGTIRDCRTTGSVDGAYGTGGIAGYNGGSIINCVFEGVVSGRLNALGGICGHNEQAGIITGSRFRGKVYNDGIIKNPDEYPKEVLKYPGSALGGITGSNHGTITECSAEGDINCLKDTAGGITGHNTGKLENCRFSGQVTAGDRLCGLIAGYTEKGSVQFCFGQGSVTCQSMGGGISGLNRAWLFDCVVYKPVIKGKDSALTLRPMGQGQAGRFYEIASESDLKDTSRREYAGWDFAAVWVMTDEGPRLKKEQVGPS